MLLRNDETEQPQVPQTLDEFRRLCRLAVPALEILMLGGQELVDGVDHHAQHFAVFVAQTRVRKELFLEYPSRD